MARDEVAQLLADINTFERVSGNSQSMGFCSVNTNLFYRFLGHASLWFIVRGGIPARTNATLPSWSLMPSKACE